MKYKVLIILFTVIFLLIGSCKNDENPLDGIWTGIIEEGEEEIKISLVFFDEYGFMGYEVGEEASIERIRFTYEDGQGTIRYSFNSETQYTLEGNSLRFTVDGIHIVLNREKSPRATPSSLRGIWKSTDDWILIFINDNAYITRDRTTDFGTYTFKDKKGSFVSKQYEAPIEFAVNGKVLDVKIRGRESTFSRIQK